MFMTVRRPLAFSAAALALLAVAGCASDEASSSGSPFTQALAQNYTDLANQAAAAPAPESDLNFLEEMAVFAANPFGLFGPDDSDNLLAQAYTAKADLAAQGEEPAPEAPPADQLHQSFHDRLMRAVASGKDRFPDQAARAQADYDCWVLDGAASGMGAASAACKSSLDGSLLALENSARPAPPPASFPVAPVQPFVPAAPPPPVAAAPMPAPAPATDYTAYFDFDSWTLTAEDLAVITSAIDTARAGGQSRITVVGHTDTSGAADYNQRLSVRRANVVVEALVDMGARREAIQASGVGENDLAVQTPDGTREGRNRRTVINLLP